MKTEAQIKEVKKKIEGRLKSYIDKGEWGQANVQKVNLTLVNWILEDA